MFLRLRRHRRPLGHTILGLFALAWMTVALQPCAFADDRPSTATPVHDSHLAEWTEMDHGVMDHGAMDHGEVLPEHPCPPGSDCPVFKAVDGQAAAKAADPAEPAPAPAPALVYSWPLPIAPVVPAAFERRAAQRLIPSPPILEFRILLI